MRAFFLLMVNLMSINTRLDEVLPEENAKSQITQNGTIYIRSEYFKDGQRIFFSPLDFALNGPDEGSIVTRKLENGCEYIVKVLRKHYERGSEVPCMVEVEVTSTYQDIAFVNKLKLWVIVRATDTTITKFKLRLKGVTGYSFALVPDFLILHNARMNLYSPNNQISVAFSIVTGIPINYLVLKDLH